MWGGWRKLKWVKGRGWSRRLWARKWVSVRGRSKRICAEWGVGSSIMGLMNIRLGLGVDYASFIQ